MKITNLIFVFMLLACSLRGQVTAQDGKTYPYVVIGTQAWLAENLNVSSYRNGEPIPQVEDSLEWTTLTTGAWCYFENNTSFGTVYGKLYNWYAITDPRGLAPEGWHIPSDKEWTRLTDSLGGKDVSGNKMKNSRGWADYHDKSGSGNNTTGFSGMPGGNRNANGAFFSNGYNGYWWSLTPDEMNTANAAWGRNLNYSRPTVSRTSYNKRTGLAVRCVRD